ncbi:MAG: AmmeMemoRadiSam system protein B [Thermoanaerobaculia bacterium]|nr:AmmeMemoRadiSam system protein B [Thermoanaerobaculia bacterium]
MRSRETRRPAVSGLFYESDPVRLRESLSGFMQPHHRPRRSLPDWRAVLLPHAGHIFAGHIAGPAVASIDWPGFVILLGPNHRGTGSGIALSNANSWETPLGPVWTNRALLDLLASSVPEASFDDVAHEKEHSLEVLLPYLQMVHPGIEIACLSFSEPDLSLCLAAGRGLARAIRKFEEKGERCALAVSSDLNHYLHRKENHLKDLRALDALLSGDPEELFHRVIHRERISMCGVLPATVLLEALRHLPPTRAVLLAHGDSADSGEGDERVVGYASVLWETTKETS